MSISRTSLLADLVSELRDLAVLSDKRNGWPGFVDITVSFGTARAAIHIGEIGLSHRNRDEVERRFQNPGQGKPIEAPLGAVPLLIGVWREVEPPVIVAFDATRRIGKETRQSLFIPLWMLRLASQSGWAHHVSTSNEPIVAMHIALLPLFVELALADASVPDEMVRAAIESSGIIVSAGGAAERVKQASQRLARKAKFARDVMEEYEGKCAMCGFNLGLCQSAHIYPASAPGSPDEKWNGVALCHNHHAAFDKHMIWIDPRRHTVKIHHAIFEYAKSNKATRYFIESTVGLLTPPVSVSAKPLPEMFERRYEFFSGQYGWAC